MMRATVEVSVRGRVPAGVATVVVVVVLVLINVAEHLLPGGLWLGPVVVVALVCFARWSGLTWSQLGLGGDQLWSGSRWALGAFAVVAAAYLAGVLFPLTRSAFLDCAISPGRVRRPAVGFRDHPRGHDPRRGGRLPLGALGHAGAAVQEVAGPGHVLGPVRSVAHLAVAAPCLDQSGCGRCGSQHGLLGHRAGGRGHGCRNRHRRGGGW